MENKIELLRDIVLGESLEAFKKENLQMIQAMEENKKALEERVKQAQRIFVEPTR